MPKILPNVREALLKEAKEQITKNGYAKTTVRSVAASCGLGLGTVYNYFKSKDMLIASFMADDWRLCLEQMRNPASNVREALENMYNSLCKFCDSYKTLFTDGEATKVFATVFSERHKQLRDQLAEIILPYCNNHNNNKYLSQFIAEALLTWTLAGKSFDEQYMVLSKLLK